MSHLVGRQQELEAASRLVDSIADGGAALLLEGEAGIGKTAVWRAAVDRARERGCRVLSCSPVEVETRMSFAGLADLLADVSEGTLAALPRPQRYALEVALLRADPAEGPLDPRAVSTALVSLLTKLACEMPLLVAIDDVQWLDRASGSALEFAGRRLGTSSAGFLLAIRRPNEVTVPLGLERAFPGERLQRVRIGPLSVGALHELIKTRLGRTVPRSTLVRVREVTGGNPLFALEVVRSLLRDGIPAAGEALPVPVDLKQLIVRRMRALPAATRQTLLFAAAMPEVGVEALALAADASRKAVARQLVQAEEAGIVGIEGERVRFSHPLFASAIYAAVPEAARRRVHARLATFATDVEQRARHLALGTKDPDEGVARVVDAAARDARRRGAPNAAAELAELAIRLTPPRQLDELQRRRLVLADYLKHAGDGDRARSLLDTVVVGTAGALQAKALLDLAALDYWGKGAHAAVARCEQALAAAAGDRRLEANCHSNLAVYCDFDMSRCDRHARAALELLEAEGQDAEPGLHAEALAVSARASLVLGRGLPLDVVERALELGSRAVPGAVVGRIGTQLGQWLKYVDDFAGARVSLEEARRAAIDEGDDSALPNILAHLAQTECWSGNWPLALSYVEESVELAEQLGQGYGGPPAYRAHVDAHLGNVERARVTLAERLEIASRNPLLAPLYLRALGFLELSCGDPAAADSSLSRALKIAEGIGIVEPGVFRVHADLIEAVVAVGQLDRAEALLAKFEARARAVPLAWSLATSARCRGLMLAGRGDFDSAARALEDGLREHERLPMPFERARTLLALGLVQRRKGERRHANESLVRALAIFEQLGAPLWAGRTRDALRQLGGRPRTDGMLTSSEERVAELAASGMTNREVAAAMFVSPKTVEANLSRVYRKLGIHSRAELGSRIAAGMGAETGVT